MVGNPRPDENREHPRLSPRSSENRSLATGPTCRVYRRRPVRYHPAQAFASGRSFRGDAEQWPDCSSPSLRSGVAVLIDGHAHLYPGVATAAFLSTAASNLVAAGQQAGLGNGPCALLLTETPRETAFEDLAGGRTIPEGWRVESLPDDPLALRLHGPDAQTVVVVAGRQIVTAERIEVLGIGFRDATQDGQPLDAVLAALRGDGSPAILPWGAGKWSGARGRRIGDLVAAGLPPGVFLGDNGGRPVGWPAPAVFTAAGCILPGSDPLPVPGGWREIGRYGFHLPDIDPACPARSIRIALSALSQQPTIIGRRVGWSQFVARQIRLRVS